MLDCQPNDTKGRQASKIKELADTLVAEGFVSLDDQAATLGLSRSTTWTILKAKHKNYGLSAALINRILVKPDLNPRVRVKIVEYVREKAAGSYGHNTTQTRRFVRLLARSTVMAVESQFTPSQTRPSRPLGSTQPIKIERFLIGKR